MTAATLDAIEFTAWPKTPRLFRDMVITEKIDGTNAAVGILDDGRIYAQSRNRLIYPGQDNAGFAAWVANNAGTIIDDLGPGLHFGEWWGSGIQRGYGLPPGERRLSLFNVNRYGGIEFTTPGLNVVPVLARHTFDTNVIRDRLTGLAMHGSVAAPGYMNPEGVVVFHSASSQVFKALIENDQAAKSDILKAVA